MTKQETKTIEVFLKIPVLCEVTVGRPNDEGQAEIFNISLAQRGNFETPSMTDPACLTDEDFEAVDAEAAKVWGKP